MPSVWSIFGGYSYDAGRRQDQGTVLHLITAFKPGIKPTLNALAILEYYFSQTQFRLHTNEKLLGSDSDRLFVSYEFKLGTVTVNNNMSLNVDVWNGVHPASRGQLGSYLMEK